MKIFLIKTGVFFACVFILISIWIYFGLQWEYKNTHVYMSEYQNKIQRLDTLPSPRVIILGGSNAAFGFDSGRIADSLQCNVQNMGLHASIGLRYMLSQTANHLKKGDILVIIPEYEQFFFEYNGSGDILTQAFLYSEKNSWKELNFKQAVNIIDGFPTMEFGRRRLPKEPPHEDAWNYSALNFNEYGDECAHWKADSLKYPMELTQLDQDDSNSSISNYALTDFSSKVKKLREAGYRVFILWPSTIKGNYDLNHKSLTTLQQRLSEYGIQFDAGPEMFLHEDSLMFDADYHVRYEGVERNTDRLIRFLKSHKD